ncbi:aspartate aminotransferase family protein [Marinicaulis aureus]|uniref:Aspartate aminotransferase family protein n=1 Tax=Hyphococcus aureus TaxID=2666033 RepID=A0ABW1KXV6_9PROT
MTILEQYLAKTRGSASLASAAPDVLPGGVVTDTRIFDPYGIYVNRAEGVRKWDVDGNEYLDFFGGHGANLLGHCPPAVVKAAQDALARGVQFAANQPLEIDLAREIIRLVPSAERVRFTGSGTEATLLAIRLARAATGRRKIVRFASHYHGWHDHAASGYAGEFDGSPAPGVLSAIADETVLLPPGDENALADAVARFGGDIAAFLIEPVGTHFGVVPLNPYFLHKIEAAAKNTGSLFILDEVLSGFRVAPGGAQSIYGLAPDLTTLAKILCGGLPGGAVAGRADILDLLSADPARRGGKTKVLHQGTFTGNPVSMAAGLAMLAELQRINACDRVNALGELARRRLNETARSENLPFHFYGAFSIFHVLFTETPCADMTYKDYLPRPQPLTNRLRMALNLLGVDVNTRCSGLLSAAHEEADIETLCAALIEAGKMLEAENLLPR